MSKNSVMRAFGSLVMVTIVGIGVWYYLQSRSPERAANAAQVAPNAGAAQGITVSTILSARQDVPVVLETNGSVVSLNIVELRPQITNTIRQVHIKEGQFVRQGDVLFTLDDRADRANLEKAQAQLVRDQAILADLDRQLRRNQELVARNFISQSAADTVASQVDGQRAAVRADEAAIRSTMVSMSYNVITAPASGRAGGIVVFAGSLVQPTTPLVTITQLSPISVSFPVPEANLQGLLSAQRIGSVRVEALIGGDGKPLVGALSFVDSSVDTQIGTVRVKAVFDNKDLALWPGQYVTTRVTLNTLKDAVVVPQAAIVTNTAGKFVYTVGPDQSVQQRKLAIVYEFGANAAVSGLQPGERIVVEGKQNLRPGNKVREAGKAPAVPKEGAAKGAAS
jgi:membrane fusion protein, multidrug efflux system